jgi:hypothetical protein
LEGSGDTSVRRARSSKECEKSNFFCSGALLPGLPELVAAHAGRAMCLFRHEDETAEREK